MFVAAVRLVHFRSYDDTTIDFRPGLNVIVGENASGKTNLLEGAYFALRAQSPRTRRDDKLISWGESFTRVELDLGPDTEAGGAHRVEVGYAPGQGKRVQFDGSEVATLEELRHRTTVFIFVPESLLLIKGSPARRRAHLDNFAGALDRGYEAAWRDLHAVLRQRNAQLVHVREGAAPMSLDPWDTRLAQVACELSRRRREIVTRLDDHFARIAALIAPADARWRLSLVSQMTEGADEAAFTATLKARRDRDVRRGLTLVGPHRDDLCFADVGGRPATASAGRDLRLFGSQGEQRTAVLALLLAEQAFAADQTGELGTLFLDDVMSELDDARRRRLVSLLAVSGQALITTTNRQYFTEDELASARIVELPLGAAHVQIAAEASAVREGSALGAGADDVPSG